MLVEYKGPKRYKGINDLLPELPYRCMDYGSEGCLSKQGKDNPYYQYLFDDIDENDNVTIEKEILRRKEYNEGYIATIKVDGTYGTELQQVFLFVEEDILYDSAIRGVSNGPSISYRYDIWNLQDLNIK